MPDRQTLQNLRGEIEFRRKLARQHTTGDVLLPDYFAKDDHDRIMAERIETTRKAFEKLKQREVDFSGYVELGAERGHRSLVLENCFGSRGIAMGLSLDQLRTAAHFSELFKLPKVPLRVCCDANNLPLQTASVPFVFCYQFLHHFPRLDDVLGEVGRVLANGWFFLDEEPMGRLLQLHLYKQSRKEYSRFNLRKGKLIRWLEGFISEPSSDEIEHGIIENHGMPMAHWRENLLQFDTMDVQVRTLRHIRTRLRNRATLSNLPSLLLGGVIYGLAHQAGPAARTSDDPESWLGCPSCWKHNPEKADTVISGEDVFQIQKKPLVRDGSRFICGVCEEKYPVVDDIPILIEPGLRRELYPEI